MSDESLAAWLQRDWDTERQASRPTERLRDLLDTLDVPWGLGLEPLVQTDILFNGEHGVVRMTACEREDGAFDIRTYTCGVELEEAANTLYERML
jgi:hypothetical protein